MESSDLGSLARFPNDEGLESLDSQPDVAMHGPVSSTIRSPLISKQLLFSPPVSPGPSLVPPCEWSPGDFTSE